MPFSHSPVLRLAVCATILMPSGLAVAQAPVTEPAARSWAGPAAAAAGAAAAKVETPAAASPTPAAAAVPVPPVPVPVKKPAAEPAAVTADKAAKVGTEAKETKETNEKTKETKKGPVPAKDLFGAAKASASLAPRAIGWYAKGCLAGAKPLAIDGPAWQVMRLSRNRNWGHPQLVALVERLATEVKSNNEWPGLLVGDLAQPRGGPMLTGHASHQVGLDADVWLTPMPDRRLTDREREDISATSMLDDGDVTKINTKTFGDGQVKLIRRAASYREVERIFVHPTIKKALCEAAGTERAWLAKVRPMWGHYYHMHIRIGCPQGSSNCQHQPAPSGDDGCGAELKDWMKLITPSKTPPKPVAKPSKPQPKKPEITLADLPADCRTVLAADEPKPAAIASGAPAAAAPGTVDKALKK